MRRACRSVARRSVQLPRPTEAQGTRRGSRCVINVRRFSLIASGCAQWSAPTELHQVPRGRLAESRARAGGGDALLRARCMLVPDGMPLCRPRPRSLPRPPRELPSTRLPPAPRPGPAQAAHEARQALWFHRWVSRRRGARASQAPRSPPNVGQLGARRCRGRGSRAHRASHRASSAACGHSTPVLTDVILFGSFAEYIDRTMRSTDSAGRAPPPSSMARNTAGMAGMQDHKDG